MEVESFFLSTKSEKAKKRFERTAGKAAKNKFEMNQSKALAILKSGRNVFLTGSAGAGKTYVLNQYIQYLKEHKVPVAVTASTGIAATHMNGMTIHSWAGIGIREHLSLQHLSNLKKRKYFRDKMDKVKVLVIDEISMLHRSQLDLVNQVLKFFK